MATRNLVPRNSGEGSVGRLDKAWGTGVFDNLYFGGLMVSMDQNVRTSDNVEFASGNFTEALTLGGVDISKLGTSISQVESGAAEFLFFSDVVDNNGVTDKVYYNTPNSNLYLSGITVASASNLKVEVQWDGPNADYMGEAFINNQKIPLQNIEQLGQDTRRFKGFIDNLDLEGETKISAEANGRISEISLNELGLGPEPSNILIDEISNATAKQGEELGSTHLKQGDTINVFVDFDTSDVDSIKIHNHGLAEEIDFSPYTLVNNGSTYRATIPVTVSNRVGSQSVAVQAINSFGSTGELKESTDFLHSSGSRDLDQTYPIISASDPTSYNGRSDGLREGEFTSFTNTISNWQPSIDSVLYEAQTNQISINNSGVFENAKTVNYKDGIYNNSDNVEIYAIRLNNGATDTDLVKVKIANGPEITGANLSSIASSASSPHSLGLNEIKAGDTVNSEVFIDGKGVDINNISLSVQDEGVSNGSQNSYSSSYTKTTLPDGSFKFSVPINVFGIIGSTSRDGDQPAAFKAKNNFNTVSDKFTTTDTAKLNNGSIPSVNINSISYPASQQAIKSTESATVNNTATNFDSITYSSPGNQLSIANDSTLETSKNATYLSGGYNIKGDGGSNNIKISATKSSNGITIEKQDTVNIANTSLSLSINNLAAKIKSSLSGNTDQFYLGSNQLMLSNPTLNTDSSQTNSSLLTINSSGTGKTSNSYTLTVSDQDTKGQFTWSVSAFNLAGKETTVISTNPNYTIEGFLSRTIQASPNSLGAGLSNIGTTVSNTNNISFENISEGGSAPNGGTFYTYQSYTDGIQLDNSYDENNKFTICNSNGITDSDGDHVFNLDKLNRSANTSTSNPASFVISE
jgi:hypothetical protein